MKINFIAYVSTIDGDKWKAGFTAKTFRGAKRQVTSFYSDKDYYTIVLTGVDSKEISTRYKGKWFDVKYWK